MAAAVRSAEVEEAMAASGNGGDWQRRHPATAKSSSDGGSEVQRRSPAATATAKSGVDGGDWRQQSPAATAAAKSGGDWRQQSPAAMTGVGSVVVTPSRQFIVVCVYILLFYFVILIDSVGFSLRVILRTHVFLVLLNHTEHTTPLFAFLLCFAPS
ncbi:unnamed protein product [Cuscuta epithymum]|uniref:Uncharacterized protein n=1 Tax=Cuscuta epithymum TaxID=186058 RepID=A0AAV0DVC3_9ASTE|nr:unnamed protein product [Cuscuta epithymum]CAH9141289.1 unnamed protein product [Cuscuta epithymum]